MASQAHTQRAQGQPRTSHAAGPANPTSAVPGEAQHFKNVTRNNGVAFKATDNISIQSYIDALTATINANDVISASRISNGRIAVYLRSKEAVINAVQHGLQYGGSLHEMTPLTRPTTRLILSNVYPEVPNSVLIENLTPFCKIVSQCRPIPLGLKNKQLSHIMSFRRQVQILIHPNVTPPDHINFTFSGTNYRVFLSTESAKCFNCGEFGHMSRSCKKTQTNATAKQPPTNRDGTTHQPPPLRDPTRAGTPTTPLQQTASIPTDKPHDQGAPPRTSSPRPSNDTTQSNPSHPNNSALPPVPPHVSRESMPHPSPNNRSPPPSCSTNPSPLWKNPPMPVRTFSEVVAKRKQFTPPRAKDTPNLTPLTSPTPLRKKRLHTCTPRSTDSPTLSQALDAQTPDIPSTPASSVGDPMTDTDSMTWEETQTDVDEDLPREDALPISHGPLSQSDLLKFLSAVKNRKKPIQLARKFTSNIPGLVKQLKPLKNSPLLKKNMQQRIYKLISTLNK